MMPASFQTNHNPNLLPPEQVKLKENTGRVRRIIYDKGYGFIVGDDGFDYFFHWTALNRKSKFFRQVLEGDKVRFDLEYSDNVKGYRVSSNTMFVEEK
jgi:cold shock CspA family protein